MPIIDYDHVVQALVANGTNDSPLVGILPSAPWPSDTLVDAHIPDSLVKIVTLDIIAVT